MRRILRLSHWFSFAIPAFPPNVRLELFIFFASTDFSSFNTVHNSTCRAERMAVLGKDMGLWLYFGFKSISYAKYPVSKFAANKYFCRGWKFTPQTNCFLVACTPQGEKSASPIFAGNLTFLKTCKNNNSELAQGRLLWKTSNVPENH